MYLPETVVIRRLYVPTWRPALKEDTCSLICLVWDLVVVERRNPSWLLVILESFSLHSVSPTPFKGRVAWRLKLEEPKVILSL